MFAAFIVWLLGAFVVTTTALAFAVRGGDWWARVFDFPRVQLAVCAAAALAAWPFADPDLVPWPLPALIGAALAWQITRIWPYTPLHRKQSLRALEPDPQRRIRILIANVWMPNRDASALLEEIERTDPDIVVALETDRWWSDALEVLAERYSRVLRQPQEDTYGLMLYSRLELIEPEIRFLVAEHVPSVRTDVELPGGERIQLFALHPEPPEIFNDTWERDAELLVVGKEVAASRLPCVVIGDLNDVAWSRTTRLFQRLSGLLDPRIGRGFYNSYHAKIPIARWPLDQVFHSSALRLIALRRLAPGGSDHFPILAELSLEPEHRRSEQAPAERDGDLDEAEARIEAGLETEAGDGPR